MYHKAHMLRGIGGIIFKMLGMSITQILAGKQEVVGMEIKDLFLVQGLVQMALGGVLTMDLTQFMLQQAQQLEIIEQTSGKIIV